MQPGKLNAKKEKNGTSPFDTLITQDEIKRIAGEKYYERGESYFRSDHVENILDFDETISALVWGTNLYRVELWSGSRGLGYSCTCPVGIRGEFCKHCVSVALQWLSDREKSDGTGITADDIHSALIEEDKEQLARIIIDQSRWDIRLRRRLLLETSVKKTSCINVGLFKSVISNAFKYDLSDGFNPNLFIDNLHDIVDLMQELRTDEYEKDLVEVAAYFMDLVDDHPVERIFEIYFTDSLYDRLFDFCDDDDFEEDEED